MPELSAYRFMWILAMFDLPVGTKAERKEATGFRNFLLSEGFEMAQFSVYMRFCTSKQQAETYYKHIKKALPQGGKVDIITITDKQYENIISFAGRTKQQRKNPDQLILF